MKAGLTGVTSKTPEQILFGAGTIHRGLKYQGGAWNVEKSLVGATNGGSRLVIVPVLKQLAVDGAWVPMVGLTRKTGEKATMEIRFAEITPNILRAATLGRESPSEAAGFRHVEDKPAIETGDFWENVAFVGVTLEGKNVVAILENALCTSGLSWESRDGNGMTHSLTFECNAAAEGDRLPWHIYYPGDGRSENGRENG